MPRHVGLLVPKFSLVLTITPLESRQGLHPGSLGNTDIYLDFLGGKYRAPHPLQSFCPSRWAAFPVAVWPGMIASSSTRKNRLRNPHDFQTDSTHVSHHNLPPGCLQGLEGPSRCFTHPFSSAFASSLGNVCMMDIWMPFWIRGLKIRAGQRFQYDVVSVSFRKPINISNYYLIRQKKWPNLESWM
jgi:hypothetical protein